MLNKLLTGLMKKKAPIFLLMLGLLILMYPFISNKWNEHKSKTIIKEYCNVVDSTDEVDLDEQWKAAERYNAGLGGGIVADAFSGNQASSDPEYLKVLDPTSNGIMGYIDIPKIDQRLPIYHGCSGEVLEKGCGHLEGTNLPIGGNGTHAVIAAHRGLPSFKLFTDLDQMKKGDIFTLHILDRVLAYEVDQIKVVLPEENSYLLPEDGKDYVTLLTCTPYGVNSHRLLVRGIRTEYKENDADLNEGFDHGLITAVLAGIALILACILAIIIPRSVKVKRNAKDR